MVVHALECTDCGRTRVGRDTDDGVSPVRDACPDCGETEFVSVAAKRGN
ncbi:hypothetical protein [Halorussus litoreus]|nr:hypothetical protein [Halorussus litoreus]